MSPTALLTGYRSAIFFRTAERKLLYGAAGLLVTLAGVFKWWYKDPQLLLQYLSAHFPAWPAHPEHLNIGLFLVLFVLIAFAIFARFEVRLHWLRSMGQYLPAKLEAQAESEH